jgi:amino acid adenylation domain-containing protein
MKKIEKKDIEDIMALTPLQQGMLFHYLQAPGSDLYFEQLCLRLSGNIDAKRFEPAWQRVIATNEILRTVFRWEKVEQPLQVILREHKLHLEYYDLSDKEANDKKEELEQVKMKDRKKKFDLHEVPFRVTLCKINETDFVMIVSNHHILYDGWSNGIILKEFFEAYMSREDQGQPVKTKFKDFIQWIRQQDKSKQKSYWQEYLKGFASKTGFPWKRDRNKEITTPGVENYRIRLGKDFKRKADRFVKGHKVTTASLFYSAWGALLQRYNNTDDVVFGTTAAGRSAKVKGIENIVGLFINTIPFRFRSPAEEKIGNLLTIINTAVQQRETYESTSLVDIDKWSEMDTSNGLFDSIMVIENYPLDARLMSMWSGSEISLQSYSAFHMTNYDLTIGIEVSEDIRVEFIYNPQEFDRETIRLLAGHFRNTVEGIISQPGKRLYELDILSEEEKTTILHHLNVEDVRYPGEETLVELFTGQVEQTPDHIAAAGAHESSSEGTRGLAPLSNITYRELNDRSNQLAYLLKEKGVKHDTIVAIMVERSIEMMVGIWGILKAGGAYMPIDPAYPPGRVNFMLEDSGTKLLLTSSGLVENHSYTTLQGLEAGESFYPGRATPPRPPITDADALPLPDRTTVNYEKYSRHIGQAMVKNSFSLQATRGCPYNCAYCHKIWPKTHVFRSAENIFNEIRQYYTLGVRRFAFIDDIFNLNIKNSRRFFQSIIDNGLEVQLFFPNGLRGDLLTGDYIDLMVKAGTVNLALALETASPRLQKLVGKNLNLEKLRENLDYLCKYYPQVILELFTMHGFPTETREEALQTLNFVNALHWVHFPYVHILKIYPNTDMAMIAQENGISARSIVQSANLAFHQLPDTLPFDKRFTLKYQADFLNRYFLLKERLLHVLPYQMKLLTEDELVQKYNSYLPVEINSIDGLLEFAGIKKEELHLEDLSRQDRFQVLGLNRRIKEAFPGQPPDPDSLKVLLIDLSQYFTNDKRRALYDVVEPPLGLMTLLTALKQEFAGKIHGKIAKSRIDFDSYQELKQVLEEFKPDLIGVRTLTYYKNFFHQTAAVIRDWGIDAPIIAGGPYATSDYASLLQDKNINLVVRGEGELTLGEIVSKMLANNRKLPQEDILQQIKGIAYVPTKSILTQKHAREIILLDTLPADSGKKSGGDLPHTSQPQDLAYIIYTSGTTGQPKGTLVEHRNITGLMKTGKALFDYNDQDVWTMYHSYCFDFSVWEMYGALLHGGRLVLIPFMITRDPRQYLEILRKERVTILNQTPAIFYHLVQEEIMIPTKGLDIRFVIFGGEALTPGKLKPWKEKYPGTRLINMYGITETTVHVTFKEITQREIDLNISNIGTPIASLFACILDRYLRMVPRGVPGELWVGGQGVSRGYLNRPELTTEKFCLKMPGKDLHHTSYMSHTSYIYKTGDLVRLTDNGEMEYLGRIDHQVKIRGNRVEPGEIERQMMHLQTIAEAVVIAREDENGNNYLCGYVKMAQGYQLNISELREALLRKLPEYMIPAYFISLEKFPITTTGKVDRKKLPLPGGQRPSLDSTYAAPETAVAREIVPVWQDILKLDKVGIHDNFFDLGGNSLDMIRLKSRLQELLKKEIQIMTLFQYPTIHTFTQHITQNQPTAAVPQKEDKPDFTAKYEIAVIGMAGRFPGARSIHEFWENLENGQESISFFSDNELAGPGRTPGLQKSPNYVKAKGILEEVDCFDASFFNYTLPEAEMMDPQSRMLHEFSWKALEDAGYDPEAYEGYIGIYAGSTTNLFWIARMLNRIKDPADKIGLASLNDNYSLSTQVAYRLNLKGPAVTVQTACSTSLVAIHHACQALLSGECDMALAGGVSIQLPVKSGYFFQEGMVFSSDGHCRVFDANADGTVGGDGVGIVVLKPLENALEQRDHIYAVIKGSAINNDGNRKVGYTAPSIIGQAEVIRRAHQAADVEPQTISYVETHGTGTHLGDPVEIQALIQAFNRDGEKRKFCRIGSVKSNIGHLDSAAGVAGFIKTVLALYHQRIPPTLHFETPNPGIDFENSPFIVNTGLTDWKPGKSPLRAGVSSFGIGGTNAHVILEQRPEGTRGLAPLHIEHSSRNYQLILLSAKTQPALERNTTNLAKFLKQNPDINLADAAYTLQVGRKAFKYRRTLVCKDVPEAVQALSTRDSKKIHSHLLKEENPAVVFMFPGLGSQYVDMGADLYRNEPVFHQEMDRCFEILKPLLNRDIKEIIYRSDRSDFNQIAQPVLFIFEYSMAKLLVHWGIKPNAVIGYSFGEYAAACAAGVFSIEDALKLIVHRGESIRQTPEGAMLSVPLPREELMPLLTPGTPTWLAIDNGYSCIVSGTKTAVDDLEKQLKQKKLLCMRLDAGYALHSPLMDSISREFTAKARELTLKEPQVPIISNVTGQWMTPTEALDPSYWARHLQETVQFAQGIKELVKEPRVIFVEVGPGRDLYALVQRYMGENHQVVNLIRPPANEIPDTAYLLDRLGRLWLYGKEIDWKGFYDERGETRYRLPLPTYSFEALRFPLEQDATVSLPQAEQPTRLPETYEVPASRIEEKIADAFRSIFGLNKIGPDEDFFELGGDSLKVITLVARLHRELGVEIPMDEVFKNPTIKKIAAYIGQTPGEPMFTVIPPLEQKEYYPLAPPQRRIFIMDQLEEKNKAYNMPSVLWLEGPVDIFLLENACKNLLQRHESLRTGFFLEKGEPVQRVYPAKEIETPFEYIDAAAEDRRQRTENRRRTTEDRRQTTENRRRTTEDRRQTTEDRSDTHLSSVIRHLLSGFIRPFDLSCPPLWRIGVVKLESEKHLLIQNIHHIISDDISIGVMITELAMLLRGESEFLAPLPVQYKDYAVWQWKASTDLILQEQKTFWLNRFTDAGELPVLEMPYDFPRPPVQTFDGASIELKLQLKFRDRLLELARNHKTTLFVMLFTAYNFLLHSYSGQEDIIVGTPITGRSHRDVQQVTGMFVNTLAMRTHPHVDKTFAEFLGEVKEETLAAFAHQLYPFEDLVEQLNIPRDISRNPLFDTMFVLHTVDLEMVTIPGVKLSPYVFDRRVSKFDITLNAAETKSSLNLELEYNTSLFKPGTMQHFLDDYVFILESVSANPGLKPGEIQTYPIKRKEAEKKRILYEFNQTEADFPGDKPVVRFFEEQAERTPHNIAVVGPSGMKNTTYISYGELNEKSNRLAQSLKEKGAGPDTIVGIMMERSFDMVIGILSILKAGGAYLPVDPGYPEERIRYMLEDSKANILVKRSNNFSKIEMVNCQWSIVNGQRRKPLATCNLHLQLAYVLYTSGSTGKPKGVMVQHQPVVNILYALSREYPLLETDTYLLKTPVLFDVSVTELLGWFWHGGRLAILEKDGEIDPGLILDNIQRYHVTHINFVPSLFTVFVDHLTPQNINRLSTLKYIFLAGETLLPHPVEKFREMIAGIALENIYGPTEATIYASRYSLRDWQGPKKPAGLESIIGETNRKIPIGKPLPNVKLYILDKFDRLQSLGTAGELCISGLGLARGYLNKPELTSAKFCLQLPGALYAKGDRCGLQVQVKKWKTSSEKIPSLIGRVRRTPAPGPRKNFLLKATPLYRSYRSYRTYILRTGDLARWLNDGNIEFLGRLDHQVKIRGNRIELGEIECYLLKHNQIKEAVVLVREEESTEKTLWAYIVSDREFEKGELRRFLAGDLPDYMIPAYFIRISRMPYTSSGKIDRKVLLKVEQLQSKPGSGYAAPGTDLEKVIAETWKDELKLDQVGIDDNFLDLGGTSLKIIRVMSRLKEYLKREIPVVTLFRYPTIRSLAEYLAQKQSPMKSFYGGSRGALIGRPCQGLFSKRAPLVAEGKDIAVIGMSCRFPGARNLDQFWSNLRNGIESISFFSEEELAEVGVDHEQLKHPDYVRAMGFLENIKEFDAGFFEYVPVEAEVMDPQVRLFHEVTWEALEDAGYVPEIYDGLIGLYAGASESFYWKTLAVSSGKIEILGAFELDKLANKDYLCARTAYKLNLKGPVVFVQTACSTSLVAIHMACRGLLSGEADMALAGGVSIMQYKAGYIYQEGMIQTPDGHCRAFDDHAKGTLAGSGLGVVVLKRLERAAADRDHIYAVIKGTAINNDGMQKIGFTAPSVDQQAEVISSAMQNAGVEVESIGYVETHGTGTLLGDPVEIEALKLAFNTNQRGFCGIGSVKTNFGHLDSAAGAAGFIKAVLALKYRQIPPSLHFEIPNDKIDFIDSPFYMSTGLKEWENGNGVYPRRAGVSSLGLGGTNVHVILEEFPEGTGDKRQRTEDRRQITGDRGQSQGRGEVSSPGQSQQYQLILLSAKTPSALDKMTENLVNFLKENCVNPGNPLNPGLTLADVAYTLQVGRKAFKYRRAAVCSTPGEAIEALSAPKPGTFTKDTRWLEETAEAWLSGKEIDWRVFYGENHPKTGRVSLPTYPFEGKSYWLEGNSFKMGANLSLKKSSIDKKPDIADWFYLPSWKRVSSLPLPGDELSGNNCCMVFLDEGGIGVEIAKRLEQVNRQVITVKAGSRFVKIDPGVYTINPRHRGDYQELFDTLEKTGTVPRKIFHLWSLYPMYQGNRSEMGEIDVENFNGFQYRGFYSLVFLAAAIDKIGPAQEIEIAVVTSNTQNVIGDDLVYPEAAGVLGAVKVIPQEYPYMICRHIDVDSQGQRGQKQELVNRLTAEYFSRTREPVVAYRGRSRWAQYFQPLPLGSSLDPVPRLRKKGVYLITGGFGNIGFTLAKYLARSVQGRLILVGRSPVPDRSQPDPGNGSSKALKIKQLEQLGGEVLALSADVSSLAQMSWVVAQAEEHFGLIDGVFHAAGDTGDSIVCTIAHLGEEQVQSQFQARVFGLMVLDRIFKHRQEELDFCLVVSSLVSVLGGLGFAAYTAAMSVMDAYIHFRSRQGTSPWMSVNTAEWLFKEEEGREHTAFPGAETIKLAMTEEQGLETFARILSYCKDSQIVISTGDLPARIDKWVKLEALREAEHARQSDTPALRSLHERPDLPGSFVPPAHPVQQAMVGMWQNFFGIEPIGIEDDFFQLGGDSLKAITILSKIHKELEIKLTIEEFFKYPNIKDLSGLVEKSRSPGDSIDRLYRSIEPVEKREYYKLSSAQERLYLVQQMNPGSTGYNIPLVLPIGKDIEKGRLESIFKQLIARHESLRTSFITAGDEPVQKVYDEVDFEMEYYQVEEREQKTEDRRQKTEDRRQKTEDRRQKTEDRRQKTENRKQKTEKKREPTDYRLQTTEVNIHTYPSSVIRHLSSDFIRPFDLSRAPLMRSGLIPLPDGSYHWIVDMHHIVSDGISQAVLTGDFIALYNGEILEPLLLQYKDFAGWQHRLFNSSEIKTQEDYWLNLYADAREIPRLDLPIDNSRPGVFTFAGDHYGFIIDGEDMIRFREMGSRNGATLFMSLLAVLNVLFYKYTGQADIIIGSGTAGRRQSDLQGIIGMFVNTLAMRNFPQVEKTFAAFLKEVSQNSLKAFENQDFQFETLVDKLDLERNPSRNPLFDISMVFQNFLEPIKNRPSPFLIDESLIADGYKNPSSRFDMTFFIHEVPTGIYIDIEYYTDIFKERTIQGLVSHFKRLLKIIINDPFIQLKDIDIVSPEEKQRLLDEFNDTVSAPPEDKTIHELFAGQVEKIPGYIAIVDTAPGQVIDVTYKELNEKSDRLANLLIEKGILAEDILGIMTERSVEMIIGLLGILKSGGAYLPIDPDCPPERIAYMLNDSGAKVLLTSSRTRVKIELKDESIGLIDIFNLLPSTTLTSTPACRVSSTNLAYIVYTSGSSGKPKGVVVQHGGVVRLVKDTDFIEWKAGDRLLPTGSTAFDITTFETWSPLLNGIPLVLAPQPEILNGQAFEQLLHTHRVTHLHLTPQLFEQFAARHPRVFSRLKYFLVGGDLVRPRYVNEIRRKYQDLKILHMYGPTENTTFSTFFAVKEEYKYAIPIGKPAAKSTVYILDRNRRLQPIGVYGELCTGGQGVARGYLNNPELTAEKFGRDVISHSSLVISSSKLSTNDRCPMTNDRSSRLYRTGDLARWNRDGQLEYAGRMDHQVKIRGFRIETGEIENQLLGYPHIKETVVTPRRRENEELYLCAYVVPDEKNQKIDLSDLRLHLSAKLPGYMVPGIFVMIERLPLTSSGKVDKKALPDPGIEMLPADYTPPRDQTEEILVRIWGDILGLEKSKIGIDANFFQLGGHSLKATLLVIGIQKQLGVKVPLAEVFNTQTIRGLGEIIRKSTRETITEIQSVEKKQYYELSFNQKRLWIIHQMDPTDNSYNMTGIIVMNRQTDEDLIRRAVRKVIERHESLRTGFEAVEGKGVQLVTTPGNLPGLPLETVDISSLEGPQSQTRIKQVTTAFNKKPFDLGKPPLFRSLLIKVKADLYIFAFCMHHIVSDGWSMEILEKDFHYVYHAYLNNREVESLPGKVTYKDFAHWHNRKLEAESVKSDSREFWKWFLKGELPRLRLPVDIDSRIGHKTKSGASFRMVIPGAIKELLKTICSQHHTTLFISMYSLYNLWLARISGQETVVSGIVNAGRDRPSLQDIVGFFVNSVIFKIDIKEDHGFIDFTQKVQESVLEFFRHQNYPLELVLDEVGIKYPEVATSFNMLNITNKEAVPLENPDSFHNENIQNVKFEIEPYISEYSNGIEIIVNYNKDLFKPKTIEYMMEKYRELIEFFAMHPDKQIKEYKETKKRRSFKKN